MPAARRQLGAGFRGRAANHVARRLKLATSLYDDNSERWRCPEIALYYAAFQDAIIGSASNQKYTIGDTTPEALRDWLRSDTATIYMDMFGWERSWVLRMLKALWAIDAKPASQKTITNKSGDAAP